MSNTNLGYRPDIDGLRAIAVGSVLICHAFPHHLPGGFIGVDIFFVISGYLISMILIRDLEAGRFSIVTFYRRRVLRIFPALFVVLAATLLIGWYSLFRPEFEALGKHIAASVLFVENLLLWSEASYFDSSSVLKPTLHLWSLAIEEQFYIVWPVLMYLGYRFRVNFIWIIVLLGLISFTINLHDLQSDPTAAYYNPLGRAWELMIGSLLAYLKTHHPGVLARRKRAQSLGGAALIALSLVLVNEDSAFPGTWALLPTLGAFFLISAGPGEVINRAVLARKPMVWVGLISYPLYLWHWVFLSYGHIWFGMMTAKKAIAALIVSMIAAQVTYSFIEQPLRHRKSVGTVFGLVGAIVIVFALAGNIAYQSVPPRLEAIKIPTRNEWSHFLEDESFTADLSRFAFFYPLHGERDNHVLFIGDSHIAHYAERLDQAMLERPDYPGALLAIGGGCIPIPQVRTDDPRRTACWPLIAEAYAKAKEEAYNRVIIGGAWNHYFVIPGYYIDTRDGQLPLSAPEGRALALAQLEELIRALQEQGKDVVLLLDNYIEPGFFRIGPHMRLSPATAQNRDMLTAQVDPQAAQRNSHAQMKRWAEQKGIPFVDPVSAVCSAQGCPIQTIDGVPIYKDAGHFNPDWSRWNATFIDTTLQ